MQAMPEFLWPSLRPPKRLHLLCNLSFLHLREGRHRHQIHRVAIGQVYDADVGVGKRLVTADITAVVRFCGLAS